MYIMYFLEDTYQAPPCPSIYFAANKLKEFNLPYVDMLVTQKVNKVILSVTECAAFVYVERSSDLIFDSRVIIHDTDYTIYADQKQCQLTTGVTDVLYKTDQPFELINMRYRDCYYKVPLSESIVKTIVENNTTLNATVYLNSRFVKNMDEYYKRNKLTPFIPESSNNYPCVPVFFKQELVTLHYNSLKVQVPTGPPVYNIYIKGEASDQFKLLIGGVNIPVNLKWLPLQNEWLITDFTYEKPIRLNRIAYHTLEIKQSTNSNRKCIQIRFNQNLLDTKYEVNHVKDSFDNFELNYKDNTSYLSVSY